ncbi:MAG: PSD1 and planctomycete cytochrome C domain-containing protein [Planctomycetota bacterium]|nr:PSD1 and planctomycete cytochrome C domain-containing protein [Planctomycetota bacterium]
MSATRRFYDIALLIGVMACISNPAAVCAADPVDYVRDVKPILKVYCVRCHGPLKSQSALRLDTKSLALKGGENGPALVPGNSANSKLIQRITGDDASRMPPEGQRLSEKEIDTLKQWIAAGAVSPEGERADDPRAHWAFQPILRPKPSAVPSGDWSRNPIDAFVAHRQQAAGVVARPIAEPHVLLRRVSLDLIGIPPSRDQLRAFLADTSPDAFQKVVDDLLASPHYGERWGRHWLDVWRYSDWYGIQDQVRFSQKNIWHWRDWVVESLNADKGYDRMAMEMLAGDEIVPFDPGNLRATGFLVRNRNTDSREQWIRDTVEHSAKAFLGLTLACVQCHDHPYDPIWHDEYYRWRNIFEPVGVGIDSGGGGPAGVDLAGVARIFDQKQNAATKFYIRGNDRTPDETRKITPGVPSVFGEWTEPQPVGLPPQARIPHLRESVHKQTLARLEHNVRQSEQAIVSARKYVADTELRLAKNSTDNSSAAKDTFVIESFQRPRSDVWKQGRGQWDFSKGHLKQSLVDELRDCFLEAVQLPPARFTLRLRLRITGGNEGLVGVMFNRSPNGSRGEAVMLSVNKDKPGLRFFFEYGDERHFHEKYAREFPIKLGEEFVLRVDVRDGLVNIFLNDLLQQTYSITSDPGTLRLLTIGAAVEFHHLRIDPLPDDAPLVPTETFPLFAPLASLDKSQPSHLSLAEAVAERSRLLFDINQAELASYRATWAADSWRLLNAPPKEDEAATKTHKTRHDELAIAAQAAQRQLALANARKTRFQAEHELKGAIVLAESGKHGDAKDVEKLTKAAEGAKKKVESTTQQVEAAEKAVDAPATPKYSGLSGSYGSSSGRRLSLARWVADEQNPLTARVAVNHIWLRRFGRALVTTVFDFGLNGEKPSHPGLLDWLAAELQHPSLVPAGNAEPFRWTNGKPVAGPWSMQHLHRLIVTSRSYRSASTPVVKNLVADPDNHWLWRMPPRRMDAETVRDSVLAVGGGLDATLGGPDLDCKDGMSVPRRSLYFHQSPERQMAFLKLFDGADSTECYQRHVSIVPHQALALFNSELAVVQSRLLARRLSQEFADDASFIQAAFEQVVARPVVALESKICLEFLAARTGVYRSSTATKTAATHENRDGNRPSADPRLHARENLVHSLFNHHDFVTIK